MPTYQAPLRDFRFVLHELLQVGNYQNLPAFAEAPPDIIDAVLEEGAKVCEELVFPLNQSGDEEGCHFEDGEVRTPQGFKEAYEQYRQGGWLGLSSDPEYGGQGLPQVLATAMSEMMCSANLSFEMYCGLTSGAAMAIYSHGSEEQKQLYLPAMYEGRWTGTMNLTEPHCGTDLGLMRTKAEPQADGSYRITGTKIFISAGEHDLTENIIHLVLARIPDGPPGIRGVSLFIVPKFLLAADGSLGQRNGVTCGSIEKKMGIKASSTCVMNFDEAEGYLLGQPHKGMRAMFTMMNAARLGVGLQGLSLAEVSYQNAVTYANDRLQGRSLAGTQEPDKAADPIIVHPDVRRMLMQMKAFTEGARAFGLWVGLNLDFLGGHPDAEVREEAEALLAVATPVLKAYFTDSGFEATNTGLQCYGGHGYIREWGMEQFVRDARISQIYEGANGIQALDLVGRKLPAHMGRNLRAFFHPVDRFIQENLEDPAIGQLVAALAKSFGRLQSATAWIAEKGLADPEQAGAAATDYARLFGLVGLGFMWAQMAKVARQALDDGTDETAFYEAKLVTARFYMERVLPETSSLLSKLAAGKESLMALDAEAFARVQ